MKIETLKQVYYGDVASDYDAVRLGPKWQAEQMAVRRFLDVVREARGPYSVLDIPVGTGRFLAYYQADGATATGIDVSGDMLAEARKKATEIDYAMTFLPGNILELGEQRSGFDVVVCVRLANWLDSDCLTQAIGQICEVARPFIILGVRTYPAAVTPLHWRWWVQWLREGSRRLKGKKITIHREKHLKKWLSQHSLQVRGQELIENSDWGSQYFIYLLEKSRLE